MTDSASRTSALQASYGTFSPTSLSIAVAADLTHRSAMPVARLDAPEADFGSMWTSQSFLESAAVVRSQASRTKGVRTSLVVALYVAGISTARSEEHTSELQSLRHLVCRLLLEKKKYT